MAGKSADSDAATDKRTNRVNEIIKAARISFAQNGFHQTSIRDIARQAGIRSPSILHYHFENKEQIFLAVIDDACNEIAHAARNQTQSVGPNSALDALDALWREIDARPEIVPLLVEFCSIALRDDNSKEQLSHFLDRMRDTIVETMEAAFGPAIHFWPAPPELLATITLNLIEGHAIHCAIKGVSPIANEQRLYVRTLFRQLNPRRRKK